MIPYTPGIARARTERRFELAGADQQQSVKPAASGMRGAFRAIERAHDDLRLMVNRIGVGNRRMYGDAR